MGRRRKQRILYFEFPRCNFDVHASVVFCSLPTISVILLCHTISILYDHTSVYEKPTNNHRSALRHKGRDWPIIQLPCPHTIKEGDTCIVGFRSGRQMVGGFHGMLLLCGKICKTSWQMGRHPMEGGSEYHLLARLFRLERW